MEQIELTPRDFKQLLDACNTPSEPNEALRRAAQRYMQSHQPAFCANYPFVSPEMMRRELGDPMQGVSIPGIALTPEERRAQEQATHDYLEKELGDQFQGVSLIVPESQLEEELRKF